MIIYSIDRMLFMRFLSLYIQLHIFGRGFLVLESSEEKKFKRYKLLDTEVQ
jgi:hypothetical protein